MKCLSIIYWIKVRKSQVFYLNQKYGVEVIFAFLKHENESVIGVCRGGLIDRLRFGLLWKPLVLEAKFLLKYENFFFHLVDDKVNLEHFFFRVISHFVNVACIVDEILIEYT